MTALVETRKHAISVRLELQHWSYREVKIAVAYVSHWPGKYWSWNLSILWFWLRFQIGKDY